MDRKKISAKSITITGMFTAIICVLSILQIPMPSGVPITLQTFAVALAGYMLGMKKGTISVFLYVLIGFIGIPVYAGMTGGAGIFFGLSGGFLYGFIFMAFLCGVGKSMHNQVLGIIFGFIGIVVCHFFGTMQFNILTDTGFVKSFVIVSLPYLIKDGISVVGACVISELVHKRVVI